MSAQQTIYWSNWAICFHLLTGHYQAYHSIESKVLFRYWVKTDNAVCVLAGTR